MQYIEYTYYIETNKGNNMMTVYRKDFCFKFDGKLGTIEDTRNNCMYFLNEEQTKACCKSNSNLDKCIKVLTGESITLFLE